MKEKILNFFIGTLFILFLSSLIFNFYQYQSHNNYIELHKLDFPPQHLECPKTIVDVQKTLKYPQFETQKILHQVGIGIEGIRADHPNVVVKNYCLYSIDTNLLVGELYK